MISLSSVIDGLKRNIHSVLYKMKINVLISMMQVSILSVKEHLLQKGIEVRACNGH